MARGDRIVKALELTANTNHFLSVESMLRELYFVDKLSIIGISEKLGYSTTSIAALFKRFGIEVEDRKDRRTQAWKKSMKGHFNSKR